MKSKEEYNRNKQNLYNNRLDESFIPYLFEYYTDKLLEKGLEALMITEENFKFWYLQYLNIPLIKDPRFPPLHMAEELFNNKQRIFDHLDKKYKN